MSQTLEVRFMTRRELPEVLYIERHSFAYAWSENDFLRRLWQRNCIGMVAEISERVIGFMIYELYKTKLHILNFAVHPDWRRQCVGSQMVAKLISKLTSHRRTRISLEVRETNLDGQVFFSKQGFRAVRVLHSFYENGEDAYLMRYRHRVSVTSEKQTNHNPKL